MLANSNTVHYTYSLIHAVRVLGNNFYYLPLFYINRYLVFHLETSLPSHDILDHVHHVNHDKEHLEIIPMLVGRIQKLKKIIKIETSTTI